MLPVTGALFSVCLRVKLVLVMVAGSIVSLNVAPTLVLMATPVAPLGLVVLVTVGFVVSGATLVLNCQAKLFAKARPVLSLAAVVTVAIHTALVGRFATGKVNVNVLLDASGVTVPPAMAGAAAQAKLKLDAVRVLIAIGLLKVAVIILVLMATPVELGRGDTNVTVGGVATTGVRLPAPKMDSCPPPPQAAIKPLRPAAISHGSPLEIPLILFISDLSNSCKTLF